MTSPTTKVTSKTASAKKSGQRRVAAKSGWGTVDDLLDKADDIKVSSQTNNDNNRGQRGRQSKGGKIAAVDDRALQLATMILSLSSERRAVAELSRTNRVVPLQPLTGISDSDGAPLDLKLCLECMNMGMGIGKTIKGRGLTMTMKFKNPVGQGAFGKVFHVSIPDTQRKSGQRDVAVKMQEFVTYQWRPLARALQGWRREVTFATRAATLCVGPKVHDAFVCTRSGSTYGVIVMDMVSGVSLASWRQQRAAFPKDVEAAEVIAKEKASRLHAAGMFHGDMHAGNVVVVPVKGKGRGVEDVWIVDYGFGNDAVTSAAWDRELLDTLEDGRKPRHDQINAVARSLFK